MYYLTEILGLPVFDAAGVKIGKVEELAVQPGAHPPRVSMLLLGRGVGAPAVSFDQVTTFTNHRIAVGINKDQVETFRPDEGLLLLRNDLLDQQIIDVHGRKVVRVNELRLEHRPVNHHSELVLWEVEVGLRGALQRLFTGALPHAVLRRLDARVKSAVIPWEVVNLIEADPRRQVKLNVSQRRLATMHPADLADIVEELSHKERNALIQSLDEVTAAEALTEVDRKMQVSIVESMDTARAAGIVEEMSADAAADLLGDLPEHTSNELLQDMDKEEAAEIGELMEFHENSAGGMMSTEYVSIPSTADVEAARTLITATQDLPEDFSTIFLVDDEGRFVGSVPVWKLVVGRPDESILELKSEPTMSIASDAPDEDVFEMVDKYDLLALPVVDEDLRLLGVITADDVISLLRS